MLYKISIFLVYYIDILLKKCYYTLEIEGDGIMSLINDVDFRNKKLGDYYKDKNLLIVGMNDIQCTKATNYIEKNLLQYLYDNLKSANIDPQVIDCFSMLLNKTEHIEYFLKNNLSVEEIKLSNFYSFLESLKKMFTDINMPAILAQAGNLYKKKWATYDNDKNIHLTDSLVNSDEALVIYSSGSSDLMREIGINSCSLNHDYRTLMKNGNYDYMLKKIKDHSTLTKVLNFVEINFESILSLNEKADIYVLSSSIGNNLKCADAIVLKEFIGEYNELLKNLCELYNLKYIDTNKYYLPNKEFDQKKIADDIIKDLYKEKIDLVKTDNFHSQYEQTYRNIGVEGVICDIIGDYKNASNEVIGLDGVARRHQMDIVSSHEREIQVLKKVVKKTRH